MQERIGADPVDGGWVGTYAAPGYEEGQGRVARVTHVAPTKDQAVAAARRWVDRPENEGQAFSWDEDPEAPGRYRVIWESRLGRRPVELELISS
jgi:hypothetical protein